MSTQLSQLFDESYYLARNPDVAAAVARGEFKSGFEHFQMFGDKESRDPGAFFDESYYLSANPDVAAAVSRGEFKSGLDHYLAFGDNEGREDNLYFNNHYYLAQNPDVAAAVARGEFSDGLEHFLMYGAKEGRDPSTGFDVHAYLINNPDVAAADVNPLEHFITHGINEGRTNTLINIPTLLADNTSAHSDYVNHNTEGLEDIVRQYLPTDSANSSTPPPISSHTNAPPINHIPVDQSVITGSDLVITGLSVTDADFGLLNTYQLSANSGTLTIDTAVTNGVTAGQISGNNSATITITHATPDQINATLASLTALTYHDAGAGTPTLTITATDPLATDTDTVGITVSAVPAATFDLSTLDGSNGIRLDGVAISDYSGESVSSLGDINGDGYDDLLVGAWSANPHGGGSGASYVVFGKASGFTATLDLSALTGSDGFRLAGVAAQDYSGKAVAAAGDVNGDGFNDILVNAYGTDHNGSQSGSTYVVFGKASSFNANLDLSSLDGTNGFRLDGEAANDFSSASLSGAGDINGDGISDIIVGAPYTAAHGAYTGSTYVIFGKTTAFAATMDLSTLDGTDGFKINGEATNNNAGFSVGSLGDINGDGFDDLIIGAPYAAPSVAQSGASYVVFGKASGFAATLELSTLSGSNGFRIEGAANDYSGWSVSSAGDVNGDGISDLLIGAKFGSGGNGSSYVVFGKTTGFAATLDLTTLNGSNGFELDGIAAGDRAGVVVSSAGDINGDGYNDLLVGAPFADQNGANSGSSYVIFGKASGFAAATNLSTLDGTNGYRLDGLAAGHFLGTSVSSGGDINGDGFDDVIIGAPYASYGALYSGSSYVIFGSNTNGAATQVGTSGNDTMIGNGAVNSMIGGLGNDSVSGMGGADVVKGANGNDTISGGTGADRLWGGNGADVFVYTRLDSGTTASTRDTIYDFSHAQSDKLDLSAITNANFIGTAAFSHAIGQVRYVVTGHDSLVSVDTNGDGTADLQISLIGVTSLVASDFNFT